KKEEEVEELLEKRRFSDDLVVNDLSWIGVEKTSVVTLVNNELLKGEIQFKIIVWVTVARKSGVIELQNKIAKAMNVNISEDDEDETLRAGMLSEILSENGRFVLILDDERERFSLENVGIPESFGGKLVLTSRSLDICRRMDCQVVKMEPLPNEDAWTLFSNKVGQNLMSSANLLPVPNLPLSIVPVYRW
ncbi:hypothetical protein Goklo_021544, partial [Gossypium klotzschianum]|nr:hypothetical protein [Gossypium klotzschianum]